jgi:hypothetical protein
MTCDQLIALAEIAAYAKAMSALCFAVAGAITLVLVVVKLR